MIDKNKGLFDLFFKPKTYKVQQINIFEHQKCGNTLRL